MTKKLSLAALVSAALLTAGVALADDHPPGPPEHHHRDRVAAHQEMCVDHQARQAGRVAFLEARLDLSDAQKPLFAKWRQVMLDSANRQKAACLAATPTSDHAPTLIDHLSHEEAMLSARLASLQNSHQALQSLYDSLTPAQRLVLDRPGRRSAGWHDGMHGGAPLPRMPAGE